jgi:hypothetical protein
LTLGWPAPLVFRFCQLAHLICTVNLTISYLTAK